MEKGARCWLNLEERTLKNNSKKRYLKLWYHSKRLNITRIIPINTWYFFNLILSMYGFVIIPANIGNNTRKVALKNVNISPKYLAELPLDNPFKILIAKKLEKKYGKPEST
jgi:hypothetical protein